jgi:HEAT repeat protein
MSDDRLEALEKQLRSHALNERKAALDELAQMPSELAVPALQRLAAEPDFLYRRFAVMGLGNHPTAESLATLQQILDEEQDSNVVGEIANSLLEFGDRGIALLPNLFQRNQNWLVRQSIVGVLMDADAPQVLLEVIRMGLQDETVTTKEAAILAIGRLLNGPHHEPAMALLLPLAASDRWRDRWRSATALTLANDDLARQALQKLQQDENHYVVAAALESNLP